MKKLMILTLASLSVLPTAAFASAWANCTGTLNGEKVRASVETAADDVGGEGDLYVTIGSQTSHYEVAGTSNTDSDSDVSYLYQAKEDPSVMIKVNDNPAKGASYIVGVSARKIQLSCK